MEFLNETVEKLKDLSSSEPVGCPRGHGEVSFHVVAEGMLPFFAVDRRCPIGGVSSCEKCRHPLHPDQIVRLDEALHSLEEHRRKGSMTAGEVDAQRARMLSLQRTRRPGELLSIWAWSIGPTGLFLVLIGIWLAREFHQGFWGLAAGGGVMLCVAAGLAMAAVSVNRGEVPVTPDRRSAEMQRRAR